MTHPASQVVLRILQSIGKRSEADLYLRLFHEVPRHSFAILAASATLVRNTLPSLVEQIRFLGALDLRPVLVLGLREPATPQDADLLTTALGYEGVRSRTFASAPSVDAEGLIAALKEDIIPVLTLPSPMQESFQFVAEVAAALRTRKLVVLREQGGLQTENSFGANVDSDGQVNLVNLATDYATLERELSEEDLALLSGLKRTLSVPGCESLAASVASPLELLKELFTVRGSGTLVTRGSQLHVHAGTAGLELPRLQLLLETCFHRTLRPGFFEGTNLEVVLEQEYRGVALVEAEGPWPYLSKFAVEPAARGEGIGRDIWAEVRRRYKRLVWRARPANSTSEWYRTLCDAMVKSNGWLVFSYGIPASELPEIVAEAANRPEDFLSQRG